VFERTAIRSTLRLKLAPCLGPCVSIYLRPPRRSELRHDSVPLCAAPQKTVSRR